MKLAVAGAAALAFLSLLSVPASAAPAAAHRASAGVVQAVPDLQAAGPKKKAAAKKPAKAKKARSAAGKK